MGWIFNIKSYNDSLTSAPFTTVLRKENFKYDIIPFNSNVAEHFKLIARRSYFRTARSHTSSKTEQKKQFKIVHAILKLKGFPKKMVYKMHSQRINTLKTNPKKFLGTTTFDKVSLRHKFVSQFVRDSHVNTDLFYLPMAIPGPKLERFIFTIKRMCSILNLYSCSHFQEFTHPLRIIFLVKNLC